MKQTNFAPGKIRFSLAALALALAGIAALAPSVARADASCNAMMANHIAWDANGPANLIRFQNIVYVYVTGNGRWTMWSTGTAYWNGGVPNPDLLMNLEPMRQYFSDRQSNGQPFLASAFDLNNITGISRDGTITMHNVTWNFDTTVNATCVGNTMTAWFGSDLLIITLNDASTPR